MSYLFFLSHAHDHDGAVTPFQRKFFDDLVKEIELRHGQQQDQIGFLDEDIATGQVWSERLAEALKSCKVFVYLQEPTYFQRPWCGKEWQVFRSRLEVASQAAPASGKPPLMFPVFWVPTPELHPLAREIQYADRELGDDYVKQGLYDLMRLKMDTEYIKVLRVMANRIVLLARGHNLPELAELDPLDSVPNAFQTTPAAPAVATRATLPPTGGSLCVQFVYVAACRDELQQSAVRRQFDCYGDQGHDWKPYHPGRDAYVFEFANEVVARMKKLRLDTIAFVDGEDLVRKLKAARESRNIVVLFVDAWSLRLDLYGQAMRRFCNENFRNSVVVVPWGDDDETSENAEALGRQIEDTFYGLLGTLNEPKVVTSDEILKSLELSINERRGWLLRDPGTTFRRVLGNGPRTRPTLTAVGTP